MVGVTGGTAVSGTDYVASSPVMVTIPAGQTTVTYTVTIKGNNTKQSNRTILVGLSSPTGATIAKGTGTITIVDDD
jgi:chitinase